MGEIKSCSEHNHCSIVSGHSSISVLLPVCLNYLVCLSNYRDRKSITYGDSEPLKNVYRITICWAPFKHSERDFDKLSGVLR